MCVEMEIGGTSEAYVAKYNDYLRVGAETGFMDSVHMYYQGGGPGEFYEAYRSADQDAQRRVSQHLPFHPKSVQAGGKITAHTARNFRFPLAKDAVLC